MMWWYGSEPNGWGYALMSLGMIVFWGLLLFLVVAAFRELSGSSRREPAQPSAEDVLAQRFARGEIDEQEYRERLTALQGVSSSKSVPSRR